MSKSLNHRPMEDLILAHLISKGHITPVEAQAMFRCRSVSRRITTLRRAGIPIISVHRKDSMGQRYVRYELVQS